MALQGGADLVVELPFPYACTSAERFASGAVQLLHDTGLRSTLLFGSESGQLDDLDTVAGWLRPEQPEYQQALKAFLDLGLSFPQARQQALEQITGHDPRVALLEQPNNILAVEYLKAIRAIDACRLSPETIRRKGQHYHEQKLPPDRKFASAKAIRLAVQAACSKQETLDYTMVHHLLHAMPAGALAELLARIQSGPGPLFISDFTVQILTLLRSRQPSELSAIVGMGEGLPQRLCRAAAQSSQPEQPALAQLISEVKNTPFHTDTHPERSDRRTGRLDRKRSVVV